MVTTVRLIQRMFCLVFDQARNAVILPHQQLCWNGFAADENGRVCIKFCGAVFVRTAIGRRTGGVPLSNVRKPTLIVFTFR
jgi:hypothetical protein